jgi:DNA-binding CsgD family transcriptional regulator
MCRCALVVSLATAFTAFFLGQALLASSHHSATLAGPGVLRAVIGSALYLTLCGLFASGVAAIIRNTAAAITAMTGLLFVLIRVHLILGDLAGARTLMREIDDILRRRPHLGTLVGQAKELRARLAAEGSSPVTASSLTAAELRLLPMLSTHLTADEIAAEMYLSPHTIKTQVKSIYRKLEANSRSQAVARARELGLLEAWRRVLTIFGR